MEPARDSELVIELRADPDRGVSGRAGAELEDRRQRSMPERHGLRARGDRPAFEPAVKPTRTSPVKGQGPAARPARYLELRARVRALLR
ncbi:MAG: hypothetical protein WA484_07430 [Solirubrobacteraceae bacterium]